MYSRTTLQDKSSEYGIGISKQQDKNPAESRQIAAVFKFKVSKVHVAQPGGASVLQNTAVCNE